jgi:hypothetical protein
MHVLNLQKTLNQMLYQPYFQQKLINYPQKTAMNRFYAKDFTFTMLHPQGFQSANSLLIGLFLRFGH